MYDEPNPAAGLIHAQLLDGRGGARQVESAELATLQVGPGESLWLHWDRSHPQAQAWLREQSLLSGFACDLLLEENTRPRLLTLPDEQLLLFLRGVNLNPGAEPEDMVAVRIFASASQVISLRLRPLRATDEVLAELAQGIGPRTSGELLLRLTEAMTDKSDQLMTELSEQLDTQEELMELDERNHPEHQQLLQVRRRAAGLRRFLAPQRDLYAQLSRTGFGWLGCLAEQWNELHNRLTRQLEELEMLRERVSLVLESEHRRMSEGMNRTMYLLSIVTCFFLPLSFITGLLGINLGGMPGAEHPYGFFMACVLIDVLALSQWLLFRRLRWL